MNTHSVTCLVVVVLCTEGTNIFSGHFNYMSFTHTHMYSARDFSQGVTPYTVSYTSGLVHILSLLLIKWPRKGWSGVFGPIT